LEDKKYIHRDIKPDNIVLQNPDDISHLKLIDFGLAVSSSYDQLGLCGTPGYIAPEVFLMDENNRYSYNWKADVFSAGAILYKMYYL
jgi:serine/threonine protein kinase